MSTYAPSPQRIEGKYEILEKISEGGMGTVYKVRHRLLEEIRVVKLIRQQLVDVDEFRARFLGEARLAIKLRHPNIAQLYDFTAEGDGTAFIVMEFISGKTLEEVLRGPCPLSLGLALEIARQTLDAIGYLHARGFVHRDISPDNLMLSEDLDGKPQIKLIDLGIAKSLGAAQTAITQTGVFVGKVRYSSPDSFGKEGSGTNDARSDLYSFGIVLYEMLTGISPILGSDPSSIIAGHLFHPPIPFMESDRQGRVPPGVQAAVLKALAKSPEERYATAQEFAAELARFRPTDDIPSEEVRNLLQLPSPGIGAPPEDRKSVLKRTLQGTVRTTMDGTTRIAPVVPPPPPASLEQTQSGYPADSKVP